MTRTHNSRVPQAVRTHVFIDMKGYGRLLAERPNAETAKTMRTYFRVVRAQLPRKAVEVDQIADTFHLAFADALEAVRTADRVAAALALKDIHAGIGLDAGQSLRAKGRYVGIAVANASALSSRAGPGQILITQNVLALVRNELDYVPRDLGLLAYAEGRVHVFEVRGRDESARDRYRAPDRTLVALLFFDMVGSTAKSAALGAAAWKTTLERHHAIVRATLRRFRGAEVDTSGDGFYATFDLPSTALACAMAIRDGLSSELGIDIRAGIHMAECEIVAGKVGGIGVAIASRVMSRGGAGDVLASQAVRDILVGTEFAFEEREAVSLKGVPGEWLLYSVSPSSADSS